MFVLSFANIGLCSLVVTGLYLDNGLFFVLPFFISICDVIVGGVLGTWEFVQYENRQWVE